MESKAYYLLMNITLWENISIEGFMFPVAISGMEESCGVILAYDSLEKFQRNHPGKTPLIVETLPRVQAVTT